MTLTGSMRDLDRLIAQLGDVQRLRRDVSQAVGDTAVAKVQQGFRRSESPDGVRWTALAAPRRRGRRAGARPLLDTYALANSLGALGGGLTVTADGFVLSTDLPYARHQHLGSRGPGGIAPRPFLPDDDTIPDRWEADVQTAVGRAIKRHFR